MSFDFSSPSSTQQFIKVTRARSQSPAAAARKRSQFCRITNKSESMEDHLYIPPIVKVRQASPGCKITSAHNFMGDYKYVYPILDPSGKPKKMERNEMMCRVTAKNQAIGDYKFVFPAALAHSLQDDVRIDTPGKNSLLIPKLVLTSIPGGVHNVLISDDCNEVFLFSSEGDYYQTSSKFATSSSIAESRRNTLPTFTGPNCLLPQDNTDERNSLGSEENVSSTDFSSEISSDEINTRTQRASSVPANNSSFGAECSLLSEVHKRSIIKNKRLKLNLSKESFQLNVIAPTPLDFDPDDPFSGEEPEVPVVRPHGRRRSTKRRLKRMNAIEVESRYVSVSDYHDSKGADSLDLSEGQIVELLDSSSENRWKVRTTGTRNTPEEGWVSSHYLERKSSLTPVESRLGRVISSHDTEERYREAKKKRGSFVKDLAEGEKEFLKELEILKSYFEEFDSAPQEIKDIKDEIIGNTKEIIHFHESILDDGLQYVVDEPNKLGKTLIRLEKDFEKHAEYCRKEPEVQKLISKPSTKRILQEIGEKLNDDKSFAEHLKLPIKRINDYQTALKDMIRNSAILHENTSDLESALDLMTSLNQSSPEAKLVQSIEGLHGNLSKLGPLKRHGWMNVIGSDSSNNEQYAFLFKGKLLLTEKKRITDDIEKYICKDIIKLSEIEIVDDGPRTIKLVHSDKSNFPKKIEAKSISEKESWMDLLSSKDNFNVDDIEDEPYLPEKDAVSKMETEEPGVEKEDVDKLESVPKTDAVSKFKEEVSKEEEYLTPSQGSRSRSSSYFTATEAENDADLKPVFKKTLKGIVCNHGDTISFECNLEDNSSVTWLKNNKPLTDTLSPKYEVIRYKNTRALSIKDAQLKDAGLYTAKATNEHGSSTCCARLIVRDSIEIPCSPEPPTSPGGSILPHEPYFTINFKDTELLEGTFVRFEIKARGFPDPVVQFYKNDELLKQNDRVYVNNEHKDKYELIINNVSPTDAGTYSCIANNPLGNKATFMTVTVTNEKDYFHGVESVKPNNDVQEKGPEFKWFRDGHEFDASERFKVILNEEEDTLALVFQHVKPEDAGLYTCVAGTTSGKISCSAELTVQGEANQLSKEPVPPTIIADLTDTEVSIGGSAMLELKIHGYPKPQITWYKDGEEIKAGGRFRFLFEDQESSALIIRNAEIEDTGTYTVLARNKIGEITTTGNLLVRVPPSFKKKMQDISVMTDDPVRFEVEIEGKPTPEVKWYKDGQQLNESERIKILNESDELFAMIIDKARSDDSGSYSCQANNDSGDISGFGNLVVNAPPSFTRDLKDVNAKKGENVIFEAKVSGNPKPDVKWRKDGKSLTSDDDHIKIFEEDSSTHILSINKVSESDVGKYSCILSNEFGEVTGSGKLEIQNKPKFTKEMQDQSVEENEEAVFEVETEGTPAPHIKWYVEGTEIESSSLYKMESDDEHGKYSLVIKKVTKETSGKYSCTIENSLGESSSSASLNVLSEPKFEKRLEDQTVSEGESIKLSVTIVGSPKPDVKWKHNGEEVYLDAHIKISHDESSDCYSLEIDAVTNQLTGKYECTATNAYGSDSSLCNISTASKAGFDKKFGDKSVSETEDIEFTIQIHGDPNPDVYWRKDGKKIIEDEHIEIVIEDKTYKLVIKGCITDDSGSYSCEVRNKWGGEEISAELTVIASGDEVKPYFTKKLKDTTVFKGDTIKFEVEIGGAPSPDVIWYRNDEEIIETRRITKTSSRENGSYTLTISDSEPDDTASYSCKASNKYGVEYDEASLTVRIPSEPVITGGEEITVMEEEDIHIKMHVTGDPYPEILWFKDHEEIKDSDEVVITKIIEEEEIELIIMSGRKSDEGDYECVASNRFGTTSHKSSVTVKSKDGEQEEKQKPKFVKNHESKTCNFGETVEYNVKVTGNPKPMVKWFHGDEEDEIASSAETLLTSDKENGEFSLMLKDCNFDSAGTYTCMAINTYGYASADAKLSVNAPVEPTVHGMKDKKVDEGEKVKFEAEVDGIPKPIVKWFKDDQPVAKSDRIQIKSSLDSNKHELIISDVNHSDVGKYTVLAGNIAGSVMEQALLSFAHPEESEVDKGKPAMQAPTVSQELPSTASIQEGENLELKAKFDGEPSPDIKWMKDGNEIKPDDRTSVSVEPDGSTKLTIEDAKPEDSGRYSIEATNDSGSNASESDVHVEPKKVPATSEEPIIKKNLQPVEFTEGEKGEIFAEVSGAPTPSIKWMKDGNPVEPDRRIHVEENPNGKVALIFDKVRPKDAGNYKLIAENDKGEVSSEAPISVKPKPEEPDFIKKLRPVEMKEGDSGKLEAIVTGVPIPEARWTKDGEDVEPSERIKMDVSPEGRIALKINDVKPEDAGKYELSASNEAGTIRSSAAVSVTPKTEEPSFLQSLQETELVAGEPGKIEAIVSGKPTPSIKWTKDGMPIVPSDRVKLEQKDDGTVAVVFDEVEPSDEGIYKIVATNEEGRSSSSAPITVIPNEHKAVGFSAKLEPMELKEGEKGKIKAAVMGNPSKISWFKDDKAIEPSDHINSEETIDGNISLNIDRVNLQDAGKYKVELNDGISSSADVTVIAKSKKEENVEPNFTDELKPTELVEDEPGMLKAVLTGNPLPDVKWMKDGENITPSSHMKPEMKPSGELTLAIDKVKPSDAGEYVVFAENELGDASSGAPVTVVPKDSSKEPAITDGEKPLSKDDDLPKEKLKIIESLKPAEMVCGKPFKMSVKVSDVPDLAIKWMKDGKEILPSDRVKIEKTPDGKHALKFDKVKPEDCGKYTFEVSDGKDKDSSSANVSVLEPPSFIQPLLPVNFKKGYISTLRAKSSLPLPDIKWYKDDVLLEPTGDHIKTSTRPDGTVELKISDCTSNDKGMYKCVLENDAGTDESKAEASEAEEEKGTIPSIIEGLKPIDLEQGSQGRLEGKVDGEPKPDVKWFKDGKELKKSDHVKMEENSDGSVALVIDDVNLDDKGLYELNASNKNGEVKTTAPVNVAGPPKFMEPLGLVEVVDGDMARLECKVSGFPSPDITWKKNGVDLIPDGIHIQSTRKPDGTVALLIDRCKPEDVGEYTCVAKNNAGEKSSTGDLKVTDRKKADKPESIPMILTPLRDLAVKEGEPFSFETRISGNPLPGVHWFLDDQPITPSDNMLMTFDGKRACLKVRNSNPQHNGMYKIKLTNSLGDVESSARAKVSARSAPKFIQTLQDSEVKPGEPAELICKVEGEPEPAITWYYDNYALCSGYKYEIKRDGGSCLLIINHPRPQKDSGRYECKAKNEMGEDRTSCRLKIVDHEQRGEAPIFLKKIGNCEVLEGMTAKFTACVSGTPEPDVKWFKNGEQIESSEFVKIEMDHHGLHRLVIRKAGAQDAGEYRCAISNVHGSDQCSGKLTYESFEDIRRERPTPYVVPEPIRDHVSEPEPKKYKDKGIPQPLPNAPFIFHMMDDYVSLAWKPSVPFYPRAPVTYAIQMCKLPDGEWKPYKSGIKDSCADVRGLEPNKDYRFRIKVENKFGVSDPSPYTTALRSKVQLPSPTPKAPRDYEIEHHTPDKMASAPRFVRKEEDYMYGIKNHPVKIEFWVYGYPQPECNWYFNGDKLEMGVRYDKVHDRNGQITLYILRMREEDVGNYMCVAVNEHGEARQKIKLNIAEPPTFLKRLEETSVMMRKSGKLDCKIIGDPTPTIKWFKDWHPLSESNRIKMAFTEPDLYTLHLTDAISKDAGLYSCSAVNLAGHASSSAHITIEESEDQYDLLTYKRPYRVKPRSRPIEDNYDIGEEIGRGTQGVVYHAVKRDSGTSYAAKTMRGTDKFREWMDNEMDIMNQLNHPKLVRLFDVYQTDRSLSLVTEFCGGGELLNNLISRGSLTESDIAHYIRQVLEGLQHMHEKRIGHLGLTLGDILVSKLDSDTIKIGDFGLAARLPAGREFLQEYGHPEYVAPEIANKQPATMASDIWSIGIISYILLSGISPFLGENDRETLSSAQAGKIDFYEPLGDISDEARDFLSKLLVFDPLGRLEVSAALRHPWLSVGYVPGKGPKLDVIDRLKDYRQKWRKWYENASCRNHYRRRKLSSCFTHPSKMIYPPGETYSPSPPPVPTLDRRPKFKPSDFDVTYKQRIVDEPENFVSESHYQNGPDTYLLQYRDPDYALRIRQYLRVGASRSPNLAAHLREGYWGGRSCPQVAVRERRRFTDVMDEEIDDEQKGLDTRSVPFRLQKEVGSLGYTHGQMLNSKKEALEQLNRPAAVEGIAPYFREKLKDITVQEEDEATLSCMISSATKPLCTWFRNDGILIQSQRIKIEEKEDGVWQLKLNPVKVYDAGVYKCVARNDFGFSVTKARLYLGVTPGRPEPPESEQSDASQIYVAWSPPKFDGNFPISCYKLESKLPGETEWSLVQEKIDHEFFVVHNLNPESPYQFRVTANNKFGWGEPSCPSEELKTNVEGSPSVKITKARKYQQQMTESGRNLMDDLYETEKLDYSVENNPIPLKSDPPLELYNFIAEIARGKFSIVVKTFAKEDKKYYAAKLIQTTSSNEAQVKEEYQMLSSLRHERIASLYDACYNDGQLVLIMEKLCGLDIMTHLTSRHYYSEENVCKVIIQVLDALQYLHFRNIGYFNLQPDNVVVINPKSLNIKLVDFGSAQRFSDIMLINYNKGDEEYLAPEILKREDVTKASDVWSIGVLTYILLSGVSPFQGDSAEESSSNVTYVRYRFEYLYKEVTQETTRFLMHIFKRTPSKRPTIEECLDHKWITPSEFMLRKRERAIFTSSRLNQFAEEFHENKKKSTPEKLKNAFGMSLSRSISIDVDTYDEF